MITLLREPLGPPLMYTHTTLLQQMHSLCGGAVGGVEGGVQSLARPGDCCLAGRDPRMYVGKEVTHVEKNFPSEEDWLVAVASCGCRQFGRILNLSRGLCLLLRSASGAQHHAFLIQQWLVAPVQAIMLCRFSWQIRLIN